MSSFCFSTYKNPNMEDLALSRYARSIPAAGILTNCDTTTSFLLFYS